METAQVGMESGDPLPRAAMGLTEGGGSRTFGELSKIGDGEIEDMPWAEVEAIVGRPA